MIPYTKVRSGSFVLLLRIVFRKNRKIEKLGFKTRRNKRKNKNKASPLFQSHCHEEQPCRWSHLVSAFYLFFNSRRIVRKRAIDKRFLQSTVSSAQGKQPARGSRVSNLAKSTLVAMRDSTVTKSPEAGTKYNTVCVPSLDCTRYTFKGLKLLLSCPPAPFGAARCCL